MNIKIAVAIFPGTALLYSFLSPAFSISLPTNPNYLVDCASECVNESYPYEFCTIVNGKATYVTKCSSDPNKETGLVPYKPSILLSSICTNMSYESSFLWNTSEPANKIWTLVFMKLRPYLNHQSVC